MNVNFDETYNPLSSAEVEIKSKSMKIYNQTTLFTSNIRRYSGRPIDVDHPEWFNNIDSNGDGIVQIAEFAKDIGVTPEVLRIIDYLKKNRGLITINLGNGIIILKCYHDYCTHIYIYNKNLMF